MHENEEIKARLPIEQLVGRYIVLKRAGRVYKALCPFHGERTPSFTVNPDRGIYKCFGCGEGGDIFDFTMKMEGLTFPETIRLLAEQTGVELPEQHARDAAQEKGPRKERLYAVNAYVAKLWHTILTQHPKAEMARSYLTGRGLSPESITAFSIGYAPLGEATRSSLQKTGFDMAEWQAAGDPTKFMDRITFPITDITGRVIAFTGRLLQTPDDPKNAASRAPKYWNTPETVLFSKSRTVFALHIAKLRIQSEDVAILAEGQMDVVMLHQHGYTHAVASSGTALTAQQLRLIGRFSTNIAFAYDGDSAGIAATKKGIELCLEEELNPSIIALPSGSDPADCLQKDPEIWNRAYTKRLPFMQWFLDRLITESELTPQRKKEIAKEIIPWLAKFRDPIEQSEWIRITAGRLQTDEANIRSALDRLRTPSTPPAAQAPTPSSEAPSPVQKSAGNLPPLLSLAELGASIVLNFPEIYNSVSNLRLQDLHLAGTTSFLDMFFTLVDATASGTLTLQQQVNTQEEQGKNLYLHAEERLKPYQEAGLDSARALEELMLILQRLRSESRESAKSTIAKEIQAAQLAGDQEQVKALFGKLKDLL
jgi:DNA primase